MLKLGASLWTKSWVVKVRTDFLSCLDLCLFNQVLHFLIKHQLSLSFFREINRLYLYSLPTHSHLSSLAGQIAFREFLRSEYSEENILFWLECEEYKKIKTVPEMISSANRIYSEFVQTEAPRQVTKTDLQTETVKGFSFSYEHPRALTFPVKQMPT